MNNIALFGATTTGASAVIDNVKISITRPPKTVGLFVGVQDTSPGKLKLPGDVTATNLYDDFEKKVGVGDLLVTNADIAGNTITKDEIYQHLKDLITNNNIGAGDKLVLYITGHGNSSVFPYDTGVGVDGINLGSTLTDAELYDVLTSLDPDGLIKKEVFLDSCHSGGFWGPPDQSEGTNKNLSSLKNIAVFTSAPESGFMYYNQNGGFFSQALDDAISAGIYNNATPSILNDFLFSDTFLKYPIQLGSQFFQGDFGDAVPADPNLFQFFYATSSDFNLNEPLGNGTVPEPATYTMLLAGLGLLGFMTRHRKNIAA